MNRRLNAASGMRILWQSYCVLTTTEGGGCPPRRGPSPGPRLGRVRVAEAAGADGSGVYFTT